MPGKITSGVAVNDLTASLQTDRTAIVSPFSRLSGIENKEGCFTTGNGTDASLKQAEGDSSEPKPEFCDLMQSPPSALLPHQNKFRDMTLTELMKSDSKDGLPPTSKEFKVILFNEALKNHQFSFDFNAIAEIKSGLLTANGPSYKYLASIAISITQAKAALAELKKEGKLNEIEFNMLNLRLTEYAESLSHLGNSYCRQLAKKSDEDNLRSFLVVESHKNGNFTRLFKQAKNIDKAVKEIVFSHDETKEKITRNLNNAVSQFIVRYFKPSKKENIESFQQLNKYIKPGAYDKIQALFKDESRNRPGHQFDTGGTEHLYDCYAEIFDHFKMYEQFVRDQNTANEPTTNGNPADHERPVIPEDVDDGVNGDPTPNGPTVDGESAEQERPAAQRHSGGGINNHFSPVFNPINSPNFVNNVNGNLLDKLDDNNRLLAKIWDQLTKKSSVSRGVQTDDMPSSVDAAVDPMELSIRERRSAAQFFDVGISNKVEKKAIVSHGVQVDDMTSSSVDAGVDPMELSMPERRPAAQFFDTGISDKLDKKVSVNHGAQVDNMPNSVDAAVEPMALDVLERRFSSQFANTYQPQKTDKSTTTPTNIVDSRKNSGGITGVVVANEIDAVIAQSAAMQLSESKIARALSHVTVLPRKAQMMDSFQPNMDKQRQHRVDQMKTDTMQTNLLKSRHHGQWSSVEDEMEKVVLKPTMTQSPKIFTVNSHYKERSYYSESGQILPGFVSDRLSAFENRSDTAAFNQKNKVENEARSVTNALRDVIDTAINRSNITMPVVDDTVTGLSEADLTLLNQKDKIENGARGVADALYDVIDTAINRSNVTKQVVDDTVTEFDYADVTLVPAKKIFTAERVKNHNYFLDMIKNQRKLEKL